MTQATAPRDMLADPEYFGSLRREAIRPRELRSATEASRWQAAQLQHGVSLLVQRELKQRSLSKAWLAAKVGWRRERLSRLLRGHAFASTADLFLLIGTMRLSWQQAALAVDPDVRVEKLRRDRLLREYLREELALVEERIVRRER